MPVFAASLSACRGDQINDAHSQNADSLEQFTMIANANIRMQTISFKWRGETVTHGFACAPTQFPPFKVGGGDPFSGGTSDKGRGEKSGWSPIPQWARVETKAGDLLIRLACEDQWQGLTQLSQKGVVSATEIFALGEINGVVGLSSVTVSDLSITLPRKTSYDDNVSEQIKKLTPLTGILRAYPQASLADPVLISLGNILPPKSERPFLSEPWVIECAGDLPTDGKIDASAKGSLFSLPGQPALSASVVFEGCEFVKYLDTNSIDYKKRPRSPYPESVLHLMTEFGDEVFVEARQMRLRYPQLFMHANDRGSFRGALERDPFLETEFFKAHVDGLAAFESRSSK